MFSQMMGQDGLFGVFSPGDTVRDIGTPVGYVNTWGRTGYRGYPEVEGGQGLL